MAEETEHADTQDEAADSLEHRAAGDGEPERDAPSPEPELELRRRRIEVLKGTIEHRAFEASGLECRELDDGTIRMSGYGSVTEHPYEVNGYIEVMRRGAFKRTLSESPDVVLLYGHEGMPMARTKAGSLALEENARGLYWTADLDAEDPQSRVLSRKVDTGLIDQCSFAFQVTDQDWNDDFTERSIKSVSIHRGDVSLVAQGANDATSVNVLRSADGEFELRAGKAISAANVTKLQGVLDRLARIDVEADAAQPELADVLGVANPDVDDEMGEPDGQRSPPGSTTDSRPARYVGLDLTTRARQQFELLIVRRQR